MQIFIRNYMQQMFNKKLAKSHLIFSAAAYWLSLGKPILAVSFLDISNLYFNSLSIPNADSQSLAG